MIGTCHHILHGDFEFMDKKNGLRGIVNVGKVNRKPKDYMTGRIEKLNDVTGEWEVVCSEIKGTYMGYMDFDGERLFDIRATEQDLEHKPLPLESVNPLCLKSDSRHRSDLQELLANNTDVAQENKHILEVLQRKDRKLREQAEKRREQGGPKIVFPNEKHLYYTEV